MPWTTSTRRARLPKDWPARVRAVRQRDRTCRWPTDHGPCNAPGRDVDHRDGTDDHSLTNLWLLCGPHHDAKTQAEAAAARWRYRTKREPETHPGVIQ